MWLWIRDCRLSNRSPSHHLIVYLNRMQLKKMLSIHFGEAVREDQYITIISGDPQRDMTILPKLLRTSVAICDARSLTEKGVHISTSLATILKQQTQEYESSGSTGWTWIATWEDLFYDDFNPIIDWERVIDTGGPSKIICCFKNEGFCSLPVQQLLELLKLHTGIIFPPHVE